MWKKDGFLKGNQENKNNENLGSVQGSKDNQERWVGTMREMGKTNKTGESNGKEVN